MSKHLSPLITPEKLSLSRKYSNIIRLIRKTLSPAINTWFFETTTNNELSKRNNLSIHATEWLIPLWNKLSWKLSTSRITKRSHKFTHHVLNCLENTREIDNEIATEIYSEIQITELRNNLRNPEKTNQSLATLIAVCIKTIINDTEQQDISSCINDIWNLINGRIIEAPTTSAQFVAMPIAAVALALLGRKVHCVFPNQDIIQQEIELYKKLTTLFDLNLEYEGEGTSVSQQVDILLTTSSLLALNYLQANVVLSNRTSSLRTVLEKLKLSEKDNKTSCVNLDVALLYDANYTLIDHVVTPYSLVTNEENEDDRQVVSKITARQYYNNYKQLSGYSVGAINIQRYYTDLYGCNRVSDCHQETINVLTELSKPDSLINYIKKQLEDHDVVLHMAADMDIPENLSGNLYPYTTSNLHTDEIIGKLIRVSSPTKLRPIKTAIITGGVYEPRKLYQLLNWFKINKPETTVRYFSAEELLQRKIKIKNPGILNKYLSHMIKKYQRQSVKERWMVIHSDNQIEAMLDFSVSRQ